MASEFLEEARGVSDAFIAPHNTQRLLERLGSRRLTEVRAAAWVEAA